MSVKLPTCLLCNKYVKPEDRNDHFTSSHKIDFVTALENGLFGFSAKDVNIPLVTDFRCPDCNFFTTIHDIILAAKEVSKTLGITRKIIYCVSCGKVYMCDYYKADHHNQSKLPLGSPPAKLTCETCDYYNDMTSDIPYCELDAAVILPDEITVGSMCNNHTKRKTKYVASNIDEEEIIAGLRPLFE